MLIRLEAETGRYYYLPMAFPVNGPKRETNLARNVLVEPLGVANRIAE